MNTCITVLTDTEHLIRPMHIIKLLCYFSPTDFVFLKTERTHVSVFFDNTFHFFWLVTVKIRDVKMTVRDCDNLIIL